MHLFSLILTKAFRNLFTNHFSSFLDSFRIERNICFIPRKHQILKSILINENDMKHRFALWVLHHKSKSLNHSETASEMGNILYSLSGIKIVNQHRAVLVRMLYEMSDNQNKKLILEQELSRFQQVGKENEFYEIVLRKCSFIDFTNVLSINL